MKTLSVESSLIKAKSLSKKGRIEESINILQLALNNFPNNMRVQKTLQNLTTSNKKFADNKIPPMTFKNTKKEIKPKKNKELFEKVVQQQNKYNK